VQHPTVMAAITRWIAEQGVYAVFVLMAIDALLPFAGELTMLYAGMIAGGFAGAQASLFGHPISDGLAGFVVLSLAGVAGSLVGGVIAWTLGANGGRALIDRHGTRPNSGLDGVDRAQLWFARHGDIAVLVGGLTPVVRSFVSFAAGMCGGRLVRFVAFSLVAAMVWCFSFAAAGWALGSAWQRVDHAVTYVEVLAVTALLAVATGRLVRGPGSGRRANAVDT
jgi:membrane protein DedA with SNARE-associated domain